MFNVLEKKEENKIMYVLTLIEAFRGEMAAVFHCGGVFICTAITIFLCRDLISRLKVLL